MNRVGLASVSSFWQSPNFSMWLTIIAAALFAGRRDDLLALTRRLAERDGSIVPVHLAPYPLEFLVDEVSLSVNTAAAGGNASLMTIG